MKTTPASDLSVASQAAKQRLVSARGDPFLLADWEKVVFLHFLIEPELLRSQMPRPFELELYEGQACISLVALTMRRFRPCRRLSLGWIFRPVREQRFLNLRTYVHCDGEPGALFLRGWLSAPFPMRLPSAMFGLPYSFASLNYQHDVEKGTLSGVASAGPGSHHFGYRAPVSTPLVLEHCPAGSLAEFAMERYAGFFCRRDKRFVFRAWHPPWLQTSIDATIEDAGLITQKFPWFKEAKLASANFAPGFPEVWLGQSHRVHSKHGRQRVLSAFYEMP